MLGFIKEEADELGSEGRYPARQEKFVDKNKKAPYAQHRAWWMIHNCVAHLMIGVWPCHTTFKFHDWTSQKLNAE